MLDSVLGFPATEPGNVLERLDGRAEGHWDQKDLRQK